MRETIRSDYLQLGKEVKERENIAILRCYQCGKCTAGCPIAQEMSDPPHKILRFAQLGLREKILSSSTIWLCAGCETCFSRCPKGIDLPSLFDYFRIMASKEGKVAKEETGNYLLDRLFLDLVKKYGRIPEAFLALRYNLSKGAPFRDLVLGLKLISKGKLSLSPPKKAKGQETLKEIFEELKIEV